MPQSPTQASGNHPKDSARSVADYESRISLDAERSILSLDMKDLKILSAKEADAFYDFLEAWIGRTGRNWYILTNYDTFELGPAAAPQFGFRRNLFNGAYSLGSVRYGASDEIDQAVVAHSKDHRYDGYAHATRKAAVAQIEKLKHGEQPQTPL